MTLFSAGPATTKQTPLVWGLGCCATLKSARQEGIDVNSYDLRLLLAFFPPDKQRRWRAYFDAGRRAKLLGCLS